MFTVNDFFCGAGGMGLGFKDAGFSFGGAWDFDKYAVESYKHIVGVYWNKRHKKWKGQVRSLGKSYHVGYFDDLEEAAKAVKAKRKELWGYDC